MQPLFNFPGIGPGSYTQVDYTLSHGIQPGRIQVVCVLARVSPQRYGTATFTDSTTGVTLRFPDCCIDKPFFETNSTGEQLVRFDILDQRWRWQFGQISGEWNVRNRDGSGILYETEKTPRELMKLCLDVLGVKRPDLSKVPNKARPYVQWDVTNPAKALAAVADTVGCVVVLKPEGRVSVEPQGIGKGIPNNGYVLSGEIGYDPPEVSNGIEFYAGATLYQIDADLEAVGEDVDGEIVELDKLSYKPKKGWSEVVLPDCLEVDKKFRDLAKKSLYRMYRIKPPEYLPGVEKKRDNKVKGLDELLPVTDRQVETDELFDGTKQRRPAWVYGKFYDGGTSLPVIPPKTKIDPDLNKQPQDLYTRSKTIDRERGIVMFNEPIYQFDTKVKGYVTKPPEIRVRLAVRWRREKTRALEHWSTLRGRKSKNRQPTIIHRADVQAEYYTNHAKNKVIDNTDDVQQQAKYYLDLAVESLKPKPVGGADYVGIHNIVPDGAIRQVKWSIRTEGQTASKTAASVNYDDPSLDISYEEKRFIENVTAGLQQQKLAQQAKGANP